MFIAHVTVYVREGEPIGMALKRFKGKCTKSGLVKEMKKKKHFEKPSTTKNRNKRLIKHKLRLEKILRDKQCF